MSRAKKSSSSKKRKKKTMKEAKGARGRRSKLYRTAKENVRKGMQYRYRDRKQRKREFRKLWITRISAACKQRGTSYSKFMGRIKKSNIGLNRKMLADIAVRDSEAFDEINKKAKK